MNTAKLEVTEHSFEDAETIVLEGRTMSDGTGVHKVLFVMEEPSADASLPGIDQLSILEDGSGTSGLKSKNHPGYNPYDRPLAARKPSAKRAAR